LLIDGGCDEVDCSARWILLIGVDDGVEVYARTNNGKINAQCTERCFVFVVVVGKWWLESGGKKAGLNLKGGWTPAT